MSRSIQPTVEIERLQTGMQAEFDGLLRIYHDAIPESERKSNEALARMLQQHDYEFRIAKLNDSVSGFSIVKCFTDDESCLLEYMAVDRAVRSKGIGRALFRAACSSSMTSSRYVLLEVESEARSAAGHEVRRRRKQFYRNLGCREVAGLSYLMPSVTGQPPPEMNTLVYRERLPATISKIQLRGWLECIYREVYQRSSDDPAIGLMVADLPENVELR
ncbi:MAG TPA: GNAT family N-acetyltransferase [Vicinamibacterales bacterium]|nr:GNAT family N-acetyltransferase [Vicinamibacterales bacterium]